MLRKAAAVGAAVWAAPVIQTVAATKAYAHHQGSPFEGPPSIGGGGGGGGGEVIDPEGHDHKHHKHKHQSHKHHHGHKGKKDKKTNRPPGR